jgi:dTDP-4-dehydrorhamnose 3,5-epimerase-like enzyme
VVTGRHEMFRLGDTEFGHLYVPTGLLPGFQALTDVADICYRIDRAHDPAEDLAVRRDDPELAISRRCRSARSPPGTPPRGPPPSCAPG